MSSWAGTSGRSSLGVNRNGKSGFRRARIPQIRTQCKLGNHAIFDGMPTEWLTRPMGLSCKECIERDRESQRSKEEATP